MAKDAPEVKARQMIDRQLRKVGWEVDKAKLRYSRGTRPKPGRNMLIAEWPTDSRIKEGRLADYAIEKKIGS